MKKTTKIKFPAERKILANSAYCGNTFEMAPEFIIPESLATVNCPGFTVRHRKGTNSIGSYWR